MEWTVDFSAAICFSCKRRLRHRVFASFPSARTLCYASLRFALHSRKYFASHGFASRRLATLCPASGAELVKLQVCVSVGKSRPLPYALIPDCRNRARRAATSLEHHAGGVLAPLRARPPHERLSYPILEGLKGPWS